MMVNCVDNANLLISLVRLANVPIRFVQGTLIADPTSGHMWCEVEIDGVWFMLDADGFKTFGECVNLNYYTNLRYYTLYK